MDTPVPEDSMIALAFALLTGFARADEGFDANPPGPALTTAWDSTVVLYYWTATENGVGSAFAIRRRGDTVDLLTANHVLGMLCKDDQCPNVSVYRNVSFDWTKPKPLRAPPLATRFEIVARDAVRDLAVIRIHTDEHFEPVELAPTCTDQNMNVAVVGFPVTADRPSPMNIVSPHLLTKRWSQGRVIGRASRRADGEVILLSGLPGTEPQLNTTADAMEGDSGGPMLNEVGRLVGVVIRVGGEQENQSYVGRDQPMFRQRNAMAAACETVTAFLNLLSPMT